jgi:hypothetical protein
MTTSQTQTQPRHRPLGVTILGIVSLLLGFLQLLGGCTLTGFGSVLTPISSLWGGGAMGEWALASGIGWLVSAILAIVVGWGALALKPWAWILGIISVVLSLGSSIFGLFQGGGWCFTIPGMILPAIILFYLLSSDVKQAFGRA